MRKLCVLWLLLLSGYSVADQVVLIDKHNHQHVIGRITINAQQDYTLHIDHSQFKDFFLSMKEMKCLEGPELWCHIPYPYPKQVSVKQDYRWLSQDLLFMYKKQGQFGAKMWQGVYYRIQNTEHGLRGTAYAVDLNDLASEPDNTDMPFYEEAELEQLNQDERWLPWLAIVPD
ncbi:MAG: hypothetical protein ABWW63_06625 [Glaciecola sp.]|jgi:hypothetical protein